MISLRRPRWIALALAAVLGLVGCGDDARAWIAQAAADSEAADAARAAGRTDEAERRLEALVNREVPTGVAAEDARVVRQDAHDRLARIALDAGRLDEARRRVEAGLALGEAEDVFTANLRITRGRVHEAAGRDREAAADYHRALEIHDTLLDRALGESP